jgi:hypothetical protein
MAAMLLTGLPDVNGAVQAAVCETNMEKAAKNRRPVSASTFPCGSTPIALATFSWRQIAGALALLESYLQGIVEQVYTQHASTLATDKTIPYRELLSTDAQSYLFSLVEMPMTLVVSR